MASPEPAASPPASRVIVLGASAGGVEALRTVVAGLPEALDATVLVVLHVAAAGTSVLPAILGRATGLDVRSAVPGEPLRPGLVLVAPPDQHLLLIAGGRVTFGLGPKENGHRPCVDTTMRSVARHVGAAAVGVVLSGTRDDGAAGLAAIQAAGGRTIVQLPADALYPGMPESALSAVVPDLVLTAAEIGPALGEHDLPPARERIHVVPEPSPPESEGDSRATRFTCPDCDGVLFEVEESGVERFRCSVGHVYSPASLEAEQAARLEQALWAAIRSLEDRAVLLDRLQAHAGADGRPQSVRTFAERAAAHRENAELLRATMNFPAGPVEAAPQAAGGVGRTRS